MMLTKKQQWRRAPVHHRQPNKAFELLVNKLPKSPTRSTKSENLVSMAKSSCESRYILLPHIPFPVGEKFRKYGVKVRFSQCVDVILIPSRNEIEYASELYWSLDDINSFRQKAMAELLAYAALKSLSFEEAREALYQPCCENNGTIPGSIVCKLRRDSVQIFHALGSH